jgi:hypothetical protein
MKLKTHFPMNSLPVEIIEHILSYLPNRLEFYLISKQWHQAIYGMKRLELKVNEEISAIGLNEILSKFKSLLSLDLGYASCSPHLLHRIALSFRGSETITAITSISDYIIYGASQCPRLQTLSIPVHHAGVRDILLVDQDHYPEFDILKHRDLSYVFSSIPSLKKLHLDSPSWSIPLTVAEHHLRHLHLTSLDGETMQNMKRSLGDGFVLPSLHSIILDVGHRVFPTSILRSIHLGCPKVAAIKLSYAILEQDFAPVLCELFPDLQSLRLSYCTIHFSPQSTWSDRICYFTTRLEKIQVISFRYLNWLQAVPLEVLQHTEKHGLKELKVHELEEYKMMQEELVKVVQLHPSLEIVRVDLDHSHFVPTPGLDVYMKHVKTLELRFGKGLHPTLEGKPALPLKLPALKNLSLWGYSQFPDEIISPNCNHIETLDLKYALCPPRKSHYPFSSLRALGVRSLGFKAQEICLSTIKAFIADSVYLKKLCIDAVNHVTNFELDPSILQFMGSSCPHIQLFKTLNFRVPNESLKVLITMWPRLNELAIKGNCAIETITQDQETHYLFPMLQNHPSLQSVSLAVAGVDIENHKELSHYMERFPNVMGVDQYAKYRQYENRLSEQFPHCKFTIRAPVHDYLDYNR